MASIFALIALCGVFLMALFPDPRLLPPDALLSEKTTLLFLAAAFLVALAPPFHRKLSENRDAATFALMAAFFVLYHLAERLGPIEGFSVRTRLLPEDAFPVSYALRLAVVGALVSIPAWWKGGGPQRSLFTALLLLGALGLGSFWFLGQFYKVGATEILDPTPLPTLLLQILGYASIAALCRAVTASPSSTKIMLRTLPFFLLALCAKFQFFPAPLPEEDAE
jgi:hypothetical protein